MNKIAKNISVEDIFSKIKEASHIALTVHVHPDGDALGSMLALYEGLRSLHKDVMMVVDDVVPEKFKSLPYTDKIVGPNAIGDEKYDLLIVLDASTFERIGRVSEVIKAPILNIDHHVSNTKYADYLHLMSHAAATGEIMVNLFTSWNITITTSMANALYLAIATDCGFFKFANVTTETMLAAAHCVSCGANPQYISNIVDAMNAERLQAIELALQTVTYGCNGKVACMAIDYKIMQMVKDDTDGFVDFIRNIDGVDIAVLFKQHSRKQTRVSFRSKLADVNQIASQFGGGGHIRAAGCTIKLPLEEAIAVVKHALEETYSKENE